MSSLSRFSAHGLCVVVATVALAASGCIGSFLWERGAANNLSNLRERCSGTDPFGRRRLTDVRF